QYQLLAELDQLALTPQAAKSPAEAAASVNVKPSDSGLTVWLYDSEQTSVRQPQVSASSSYLQPASSLDEAERLALDDEIAFRQSPTFEDVSAPIDIPANLIEFPRQLVASRKARPR